MFIEFIDCPGLVLKRMGRYLFIHLQIHEDIFKLEIKQKVMSKGNVERRQYTPAYTPYWTKVGLTLGHRLRR